MKMADVEKDIISDLEELGDPISQYTYLIGCAQDCESFPEQYRTEEHLIHECQVNTWMYAGWKDERVVFLADSESLIVRGALALMQELYDGRSREEIVEYRCGLLEEECFSRHFTKEQLTGLRAIIEKLETQESKNRPETCRIGLMYDV